MGFPRLGGQGGNGGDVYVVATKNMTLKRIKDKFPEKRFVAGAGANSRFVPINTTQSFLPTANTEYLFTNYLHKLILTHFVLEMPVSQSCCVLNVCKFYLSIVSEH